MSAFWKRDLARHGFSHGIIQALVDIGPTPTRDALVEEMLAAPPHVVDYTNVGWETSVEVPWP